MGHFSAIYVKQRVKQYIILNTSRKHVNYEEDKNKVPMNKPCNIHYTNICNGIFHISFFKALLINEGETTWGEWE
jgi:phage terminase large subunit